MSVDPHDRSAFLRVRCAGDPSLREEVEHLLSHLSAAGEFLEETLTSVNPADLLAAAQIDEASSAALPPGTVVGGYVVAGVIGTGGMGVVYRARQASPQRDVALKVVRPGYATPGLLRRFDLEAQVLGRLQHPGIAQIFEAGAADIAGARRPFFAMELIEGTPLCEYAHARRLGTRDRLDLVAKVCDAVHHAHQRGLIHRDLKPANILVTPEGQPKVLDFGVARATDSDMQVTTAHTDAGQLIGTLPYMSPEQVSGDPLAVDTRSDVYALGVVLFELLTGRLPYDVHRKVVPEAARIIRDEEPTRLSSIDRVFRGDIETIATKALEKDRERRYQSAAQLGDDIRRYLRDEPIVARPPTASYQLRKFAKRNKALVAGAAGIALALILGIVSTSVFMVRAQREAERARHEWTRSQRITEFLRTVLAAGDPREALGREVSLREVLDRASARAAAELADQPEIAAAVHLTIGQIYGSLALYDKSERHLRAAIAMNRAQWTAGDPVALEAAVALGSLLVEAGKLDASESVLQEVLALPSRALPDHAPLRLRAIGARSDLLFERGRFDEAAAVAERALRAWERTVGRADAQALAAVQSLGLGYHKAGRLDLAEPLLRETLEGRQRLHGNRHPDSAVAMWNLAGLLKDKGDFAAAEALFSQALDVQEAILGSDHPSVAQLLAGIAGVRRNRGDPEGAEQHYRRSLEIYERLGEHVRTVTILQNLASLRQERGDLGEAASLLQTSLRISRGIDGEESARVALGLTLLARVRALQGEDAEAESLYRSTLDMRRRLLPQNHPTVATTLNDLGWFLARRGEFPEAESLLLEALAVYRARLGDRHIFTASVLKNLGSVLTATGRLAAAEETLRESLSIVREAVPDDAVRHALMRSALGECLAAQARFEEAEAELAAAYDAQHPAPGDGQALAETIQRLERLYAAWGDAGRADAWRARVAAADPAVAIESASAPAEPLNTQR